jgi:hypothetical protein
VRARASERARRLMRNILSLMQEWRQREGWGVIKVAGNLDRPGAAELIHWKDVARPGAPEDVCAHWVAMNE